MGDWSDLHIGALLGTGAFSSVFEVSVQRNQKDDSDPSPYGRRYALKVLHEKVFIKRPSKVAHAAADLVWEAHLLSRLNHENIVHIYGMSRGHPAKAFTNDRQRGFFLVLDRLDETLQDRLERWNADRHDNLLERLENTVLGIVKGMEYLHQNNIMLCDLKPQNIGYDAMDGKVKLIDFGLAANCCTTGEKRFTKVGTFRYQAPEMLLKKGYDFSSDVYSFGIVLYQVCSLQLKFVPELKRHAVFIELVVKRGKRLSLKSHSFPKRIHRLIKECWHANPQVRPTFPTIRRRLEKILASSSNNTSRRHSSECMHDGQ